MDDDPRLTSDDFGLQALLEPVVESVGFDLLGVEYHAGRHAVLRLYIDSADGVTVDDCSRVSLEVGAILDVEDPVPGGYDLEVSSPGLNRPLFRLSEFRERIGERVKIRLTEPVEGRRNVRGVIEAVEDQVIHVRLDDGRRLEVPFADIGRANLVVDMDAMLSRGH